MDDILYDKQAEGLMTLADTTFKNIVEHLEGKASNFLIEVGEGLSDYD